MGWRRSRTTRRLAAAAVLAAELIAVAVGVASGPGQAAGQAPAATIRARQHFFGVDNVDPSSGRVRNDRVILSWFSVSSLAAALRGHIVLLDAFVNQESNLPGYVGTDYQELSDLRPEAIFYGHGHSDHGEGVAYIVKRTGARVYGTPEHCDQARDDAVKEGYAGLRVACVGVVSRNSVPGAEVNRVDALGSDVCVTAMKHLHSAPEPPDTTYPPNPVLVSPPEASAILMHPPGQGPATPATAGNEGWSLLYQFSIGSFTLTWHDTSGPLKETYPAVFDTFRTRLAGTSVEAGAIWGLNIATNGFRDVALYVKAIQPRIFVPLHHDFVQPYNTGSDNRRVFEAEEAIVGVPAARRPLLDWLYDPSDYLRPGLMTFDPSAPYWALNRDPARPACTTRTPFAGAS